MVNGSRLWRTWLGRQGGGGRDHVTDWWPSWCAGDVLWRRNCIWRIHSIKPTTPSVKLPCAPERRFYRLWICWNYHSSL